MAYVFTIPGPLVELANNRRQVRVDGNAQTIDAALSLLWRECPAVRDRVITERGEVRQHINIFIDGENIRDCGGLGARTRENAEIVILPAVSGG